MRRLVGSLVLLGLALGTPPAARSEVTSLLLALDLGGYAPSGLQALSGTPCMGGGYRWATCLAKS